MIEGQFCSKLLAQIIIYTWLSGGNAAILAIVIATAQRKCPGFSLASIIQKGAGHRLRVKTNFFFSARVCVCACVCVRARARNRGRERTIAQSGRPNNDICSVTQRINALNQSTSIIVMQSTSFSK